MNERLKFRAWDIRKKEMVYDALILAETKQLVAVNAPYFNSDFSFFDGCKWIQYTGLKDKNGKEGYHKDIIDHPVYGKGVIEWYVNGWAIHFDVMSENVGWMEFGVIEQSEIIGNIYENPELIKQ